MCLSKNHLIRIFVTILIIKFQLLRAECDVCQDSNAVACHSETVFSLCINGTATRDDITCPEGFVSTADYLVCYPKLDAVVSCPRDYVVPEDHINSCGICNEPDNVFSCISERKIVFCFGQNEPNYEYTAICPEGSVCDLRNKNEFCTNATEIEPSCIVSHDNIGKTTIRHDVPTDDMNDSTEMITIVTEMTITTISSEEPATPTTTDTTATTIEMMTTEPITRESTGTHSTTTELISTDSTTIEQTTIEPTTREPTRTTTQSTTTEGAATTRLPRDPTTLCKEIGEPGLSYPLDNDTVCTHFIMCYRSNGILRGLKISCDRDMYFNTEDGVCKSEKPANCA